MNEEQVYECLKQVIDPELGVDIVSLGLVYEVEVCREATRGGRSQEPGTKRGWLWSLAGKKEEKKRAGDEGKRGYKVKIVMTLTSPGCPLAHVFDPMVRESLRAIEGLDVEDEVEIRLTFDPPWTPEMMSEEAKAEFGFD